MADPAPVRVARHPRTGKYRILPGFGEHGAEATGAEPLLPPFFARDHPNPVCHPSPVTTDEAAALLDQFREGLASREDVLRAFQAAPVRELGFAAVDTHRALRKGFPEVIFGSGKTPPQIVEITRQLLSREQRVLVTRVSSEQAAAVIAEFPQTVHHETARCLTLQNSPAPKRKGRVAVVCAGTSDLPVAEEAVVTAEIMGNLVDRVYDVGVAGLHRLLARIDLIQKASVVVVVAGMEGALPSVIAGLVCSPVIAVPTSIGYGANFGGLAALLGMLNSCGSGVTVVNIDNGFGAGYAAGLVNALGG